MSGDPRERLRAAGAAAHGEVDMADLGARVRRRRRLRRIGTMVTVLVQPTLVAGGSLLVVVSRPPQQVLQETAVADPQDPAPLTPPAGDPAAPPPAVGPPPAGPRPASAPAAATPAEPADPAPADPAPRDPGPTDPGPTDPRPASPAPTPPGGDAPESFAQEAEDAPRAAPLRAFADPAAAGGAFVAVPDGTGEAREGSVEIAIAVPRPGRYALWARVRAPSTSSNSFFVEVNGGERFIWHAPGPADGDIAPDWTWSRVGQPGRPSPGVYDLDAGEQRIRFLNRQDGTQLDRVVLTPDLTTAPS